MRGVAVTQIAQDGAPPRLEYDPGHPQANFAVESVIDELAEKLDLDPLEFRLINSVQEGDRAPSGVPFTGWSSGKE